MEKFNQFQEDAKKLLSAADNLFPDGLFEDDNDDLPIGVNDEAWERYKNLLRGIMAAHATGWDVLRIKHLRTPSTDDDFAAVTVTIQGACAFTNDAKTALALAAMLADRVSTTTDNEKVWLNFVVGNIWTENGGKE